MNEYRSEWMSGPEGSRAEVGTVTHEGRDFSAGGALVTPTHLVCYPDDKGNVNDWQGNRLGTYVVVSSRRAVFFGRPSWQGERYYFMRASVDGRTYSIRGFGPGMIAKGRAAKPEGSR